MQEPKILARALITPDGTVLQTFSGHDYKEYTDKNGEWYMIDGGLDKYGRSSVNKEQPKYICVTTDSDFELQRKWFHWGTRGKNGDQPLEYKPLMNLEDDHIRAIIETQTHLDSRMINVFKCEIAYREKNKLEGELEISKSFTKKIKL